MITLPAKLGLTLRHEERVTSTNGMLVQEAASGAAAGLVILADLQSHGRGRQGRTWISGAGTGLTFSVLRRPPVAAPESIRWTLLAGVAVVSVLQERLPEAWLKWPNDILVGERKVGGILCERFEGVDGLSDALIVGIGLNLRTPPSGWPPELEGRATSIQDEIEGQLPSELRRAALLESILERFLVLEKELVDAGPAALMHQYRRLMAPLIGREVSVQRAGKGVVARVLGVRDNGALEVQDGTGASWAVVAGDVHLGRI